MDKVFTNKKFRQIAATLTQLRSRGLDGTPVDPDTTYIPLVVTPETGVPSTPFTEVDLRVRAHPIFRDFLGYVTPPTVLSMADLQLLEGIAEWYPQADFVEILSKWRATSVQIPTPLQAFLETSGFQRPLPKHIFQSRKAFQRLIDRL
jgi:hypothetical protein